MENVPVNVIWV